MKTLHIALIIQLLLCVFCAGALALQTGEKAPAFKLNDQFRKTWDLAGMKGQVVVIVGADRDSGRLMDPWVGGLKDKFGTKIQLLGLLDLHTVPWIGRGIARSRIRKETKDPLALDFDGATGKAYDINGKRPVVVVIDKTGAIKHFCAATFTEPDFKATVAAIEEAMK